MLKSVIADSVVFTVGSLGSKEGITIHQGVVWNIGTDLDTGNVTEGIIFADGIALYTGGRLLGQRHIELIYLFDSGDVEKYILWDSPIEELQAMAECCDVVATELDDEWEVKRILEEQVIYLSELNEFNNSI